jgi:N-acetylglucosaminyldiphosphoundecaprenol N-acetyl-beta-D-mannosaminyltransferase
MFRSYILPRKNDLVPRVNVLGVGISVLNIPTALNIIEGWIINDERHYVCVTGVHGVMEAQHDKDFKRILNSAGLCTPDGMPMVWLGRLNGFRKMDRVYGPDLMLALCELSARKGYRNFFYGGAQGVPEKVAAKIKERFPGFVSVGAFSPPFRPLTSEEDENVVSIINRSGADILWVGLSTPKQERWMAAHLERLEVPVMLGVGAAFDFLSGRVKQAPRFLRRLCLEWLYRLIQEPKRLWKRYATNNPLFLMNILLQLSGLKQFPYY